MKSEIIILHLRLFIRFRQPDDCIANPSLRPKPESNKSNTLTGKRTKNNGIRLVIPERIDSPEMPFTEMKCGPTRMQYCVRCVVWQASSKTKPHSYRVAHLSCSHVICQYFRLFRQISAHHKFYRALPESEIETVAHTVYI